MFHNKITNQQSKLNIIGSNEKLIYARGLGSYGFNNEANIENNNPSLIFEMKNRNKFNENKQSSEEKRSSAVITNRENKSHFSFYKNPAEKIKNGINAEETSKKFYYNKKFISKSNSDNREDDIISNFNPKHNKLYNYLLKTNSFSGIANNKINDNNDFFHNHNINNNNINTNEKEYAYTLNNYNNKDQIDRNSIDSLYKKHFEKISKSKEKFKLSNDSETLERQSIKNSFYYSLKGKLRKQSQANFIPGANTSSFKNEEIKLKRKNKQEFSGNLYKRHNNIQNYNNNNKSQNEIIDEEVNFNNSQISMKIEDSTIVRTKPVKRQEASQKLSFQLEKINLERESSNSNSPRRVKDIMLNSQIEKEYAEVEKKNNPVTNLICNNNREMTEEDFYRNFNIFNMNNLNLSHIKLKKNFFTKSPPENNILNSKKSKTNPENVHLFPKTQVNKINKDLVLDGIYNIVELKTSLKKKKNKFIITNGHFIV